MADTLAAKFMLVNIYSFLKQISGASPRSDSVPPAIKAERPLTASKRKTMSGPFGLYGSTRCLLLALRDVLYLLENLLIVLCHFSVKRIA